MPRPIPKTEPKERVLAAARAGDPGPFPGVVSPDLHSVQARKGVAGLPPVEARQERQAGGGCTARKRHC